MYVSNNGEWVSTGETEGTYPGDYAYDTLDPRWYELSQWSGDGGSGALELNGTPGYYFSSVDTTYWLNSAGQVIDSYENSTNIAQC
jgi:hypothetical protein